MASNREKDRLKGYLEEFREDWDDDRENRKRATDDLEFQAGEQWDAAEKRTREADGRPCLTINRLPQFIRQVVGDLRNIRPSIKVRPNGAGSDEDVAEIINGLIRNIEDRSKDEQPYLSAVQSAVRCGIGHFRIVAEHLPNNPFAQDIFIRPIHNPNAVVWDRAARSITRSDAGRCFIRAAIPKAKFEKEFPGAQALDFGDGEETDSDALTAPDDKIIIAEMYEVTRSTAPFMLLDDGAVIRRDRLPQNSQIDEVNSLIGFADGRVQRIVETREAPVRLVKWRKITGADILDEADWITEDIPVIAVIGDETHFEKAKIRAGLIRWAKDPQRLYNFWRSVQTEIIGASPKAPYILGTSQIKGYEELWADANKGLKPFLAFDDSRNPQRPTREIPPVASQAMSNEIALAAEDMKATTGIFDSSLGNRSNETSGIAIRQRQQEGDTSTNFFADNLSASMRRAGKIMIDAIRVVYDAQRVVRILQEDGSAKEDEVNKVVIEGGAVKLYNDLTVGDYDVSVDIGPSFTTRRQEAIEGMVSLLQGNPQLTGMFLDIIARRSDWPGAEEFAERAKKLLPPGVAEDEEEPSPEQQAAAQQAAQVQQVQQQMLLAKAQSDLAEQQAKTAKLGAETQKTAAEIEETLLDNAVKKLELSLATGQLRSVVEAIVAQTITGQPLV